MTLGLIRLRRRDRAMVEDLPALAVLGKRETLTLDDAVPQSQYGLFNREGIDMNKPTILGATSLALSAYLCIGCSGDDNNTATANVGGQGAGAMAGTTAAGGGVQAGSGNGGSVAMPITNGYLTQGSLKGAVGTRVDADGSTITRAADSMCVTGTAIQIPAIDGGYDNTGAWGAAVGWALNQEQLPDGGVGAMSGADLSSFTRIVVGLSGATGLNLRIQLEVADPDGGTSTFYCAGLPTTGTLSSGMLLSSLTASCWQSGGAAFDPATVRPIDVAVLVLSDIYRAYPFDFCLTQLAFQ